MKQSKCRTSVAVGMCLCLYPVDDEYLASALNWLARHEAIMRQALCRPLDCLWWLCSSCGAHDPRLSLV
jgi:hypothetical protein